MRRVFILAALLAAVLPSAALPAGPRAAPGGGHGTVDGVTPFSQFGFGVTLAADGSARGSFNCLMARASQFPGFDLMAVRGRVRSAVISGDTATFDGVGMFQAGNQGKSEATSTSS
jgi:hypothetical protein